MTNSKRVERVSKYHLTRPERFYYWRRRIFRFAIWEVLYRYWFKLHVDGWENIPATGPVLMIGNHVHALDPVVMISFFPDRDIIPMAKIESFSEPIVRYFVGHYGAIPVQRGEVDLTALKKTFQTVKSEDSIGMLYIEGTRSRTGLSQGEEGSVYVGLKTNATVVPVAIWGTRSWPRTWVKQFRRPSIYVRFGQPFRFSHEGKRLPRDLMPAMTTEAMYRIAELLPSEWRGMYSDLSNATSNHLDFDIQWQTVSSPLPKRVQYSFSPDALSSSA